MGKITSTAALKNTIHFMEAEQKVKGKLLWIQLDNTIESIKPVNILKNTIQEISSSPFLMKNMAGAVVGLATGYISKRLVFGTSGNIIKRILGVALQFGVTNIISRHPDEIAAYGQAIQQRLFHKKKPPVDNLP